MPFISRRIRRYRQNSKSAPSIPDSRYGYEIPEDYTVLHDGQVFLQYDSRINDKNRFLIFTSNQGMDDLVLNFTVGVWWIHSSVVLPYFISRTLFIFVLEKYTFRDLFFAAPQLALWKIIRTLPSFSSW